MPTGQQVGPWAFLWVDFLNTQGYYTSHEAAVRLLIPTGGIELSNRGNGVKQPEDGQKKRPKNGNGHGRHVGVILPEEYPEAIIAISLAIESCKNLQSTKDAKTFSRCLAGSGEKHGIRSVVCEEMAGKCMVVSKIKAGHNLLVVYGEVDEYRELASMVSLAREALARRVQQ